MDKPSRVFNASDIYPAKMQLLPAAHAAREAIEHGAKVRQWLAVVRAGDLVAIKALREKGFSVSSRDSEGFTGLHLASQTGQCSIVQYLLEQGAQPNDRNASGNTALHLVAFECQEHHNAANKITEKIENQRREKLRRVIEATSAVATLDVYCAFENELKALEGQLNTEKVLIDTFWSIARVLIEKGAHINVRNKQGKRAEDICSFLMDEEVYVPWLQALTNKEFTEENKAICNKYLSIGADPNNKKGVPILHVLVSRNFQKAAELLLANGARMTEAEPELRFTALHIAGMYQNAPLVNALLICPQGSPAQSFDRHISLLKAQQAMVTLQWYIKQSGSLPEMPKEVLYRIYSLLLPKTKDLINRVPLRELVRYKKFLGKQVLVDALVERHMRMVTQALHEKEFRGLLPYQAARNPTILAELPGFMRLVIGLEAPNEVSKLLDPAENVLEKQRAVITANYTKLLA